MDLEEILPLPFLGLLENKAKLSGYCSALFAQLSLPALQLGARWQKFLLSDIPTEQLWDIFLAVNLDTQLKGFALTQTGSASRALDGMMRLQEGLATWLEGLVRKFR